MDIVTLYQDFNIPFQTEGHKHCRPGWVNTACPFCTGNPGLHLGYSLDEDYYKCWRCGSHPTPRVLGKLLGLPYNKVQEVIRQYKGTTHTKTKEARVIIRKPTKLPSDIIPLTATHRRYLEEQRGFDADKLIQEWGLQSTGPVSLLDKINYSHRIFFPIHWNGQRVSFQTRLGREAKKEELKYLTCPQVREVINHKHIVYGQQAHWTGTGICVEGVTDVWRFGVNSFATFGIEFTPYQVRVIAKHFKRVAVVFDDEEQASEQADKLVSQLGFYGLEAFKIDIKGDPGGMSQEEANYLVKQII